MTTVKAFVIQNWGATENPEYLMEGTSNASHPGFTPFVVDAEFYDNRSVANGDCGRMHEMGHRNCKVVAVTITVED